MKIVSFGYWLHPNSHRVEKVVHLPDETTEQEIDQIADRLAMSVVWQRYERETEKQSALTPGGGIRADRKMYCQIRKNNVTLSVRG